MKYKEFKQLKTYPKGLTQRIDPEDFEAEFPLLFDDEKALLEEVDETFDSFEDIAEEVGIESWIDGFKKTWPDLKPLAILDTSIYGEDHYIDSYSEILYIVDIAKKKHPVYSFRAEEFDNKAYADGEIPFTLEEKSFKDFYNSLIKFVKPE